MVGEKDMRGIALVCILFVLSAIGCMTAAPEAKVTTTPEYSSTPSPTVAPTAASEGKTLFEQKCSQCHSLSRATSQRKSYDAWLSTVLRMKNQNGCPITDKEAVSISEYLAANYR